MPEGLSFEKWSFERKFKFISKFKEAFCSELRINPFSYEIKKESINDAQDYDFIIFNKEIKKPNLKVQHTYAGAQAEKEYIKPNDLEKVINMLRESFSQKSGLSIYLNIPNPPKTDEDRKILVYWLFYIIGSKIDKLSNSYLFSYRKEDEEFIQEIKKWVDVVEVMRIEESDGVRFAYGSWEINDTALLSDDIRTSMAVGKKEEKYTSPEDLILIVHFTTMPVSDFYLPTIKGNHSRSKFKGIWLYDEWKDNFIKIK